MCLRTYYMLCIYYMLACERTVVAQLRMQSPFAMEAASQQSETDALQEEKIVMEETQPSVPVQKATHTIEKTKSWMKFYRYAASTTNKS